MQKKPLTGWLILLIVILGPLTFGQAIGELARPDASLDRLYATYPSLLRAVIAFRLLTSASVCVSVYAAWVLYRRRPGTLGIAQACLIVRAVLTIAASVVEPLLAGLPADVTKSMYNEIAVPCGLVILLTGIWYYYLIRSKRVSEIYAQIDTTGLLRSIGD